MIFILNLTACATLNESECQTANWEIIGLEDGSAGKNTSYIGQHRKACADYKVAPDLKAYLKGHATGMRQFCTEKNGYQQGLQGRNNNNLCPADSASRFDRGFRQGHSVYLLRSEINQIKRQIGNHDHRLDDIASIKSTKEEAIISRNTREAQRRDLLVEIKDLERESESIRYELDHLRVDLIRLEEDYQRLLYTQRR